LKRLLSSFKDSSSEKDNEKRERRNGKWVGGSPRQPVEKTKKNKGSLIFWGKNSRQTQKKAFSKGQPDFYFYFYLLGSSQLIQAVHKLKCT
jgi:hypothetical protein